MNKLQKIIVPRENVNDEFVTFFHQPFINGEKVTKGDVIAELESSKATFEVEAKFSGYIYYLFGEGDQIPINDVFANIYDQKLKDIEAPKEKTKPQKQNIVHHHTETENNNSDVIFSKDAVDYIVNNKIDRKIFSGYSFVGMNEINEIINSDTSKKEKSEKSSRKISVFKKREIEYLSSVQGENLNSTLYIKVNTKYIELFLYDKLQILKSSLSPAIIYECSRLLKKYNILNSYFSDNHIIFHDKINIGLAFDIEDKGLKVVSIPGTDSLSIFEIENIILELGNKYIDNLLTTDDMKDITFTVTDLSNQEVSFFTPLIGKNNSAILGISAIDKINHECYLSLSFDHRVSEGRIAGEFLKELKNRIESYTDLKSYNAFVSQIKCSHCLKSLSEDISKFGFIKIMNKKGGEEYICQTCFNGF